jgi:hypothetical protein
MDISLEGIKGNTTVSSTPNMAAPKKSKGNSKPKLSVAVSKVVSFLEQFTTAKIVIVIETHCMENGCFVWKGTSADTYKACALFEVSSSCDLSYHTQ